MFFNKRRQLVQVQTFCTRGQTQAIAVRDRRGGGGWAMTVCVMPVLIVKWNSQAHIPYLGFSIRALGAPVGNFPGSSGTRRKCKHNTSFT